MRVVLDTNVVVSRTLTPHGSSASIFQYWYRKAFDLVVSEEILQEYRDVLLKPQIQARHGRNTEEIAKLIERFRKLSVLVAVPRSITIVHEDPDDNKFIECAVAGKAGYIISGDRHLLELKEYQGIHILSPAVFLTVLKERDIFKKAA